MLVTSMHRKSLDPSGKIRNTLGDYPEAVRQAAREEDIPLIDLHALELPACTKALGPNDVG